MENLDKVKSLRTPLRKKLLCTVYFYGICTISELMELGFKKRTSKIFLNELITDKLVTQIHRLYKITPKGKLAVRLVGNSTYISIWFAKLNYEHNRLQTSPNAMPNIQRL